MEEFQEACIVGGRGRTCFLWGATTALGLMLGAAGAVGAVEEPVPWKTGLALRRQLELPAGVAWSGQTLRQGLTSLSRAYGVAIFLDRRLDPDRTLDLRLRDRPLQEILQEVARHASGDLAQVAHVLYVGPPEAARRVATLAALRRQEVASLPADLRRSLTASQPLEWPELAQPGELVQELVRQAGLRLEHADLVPLDLWPAGSLPPLAWTDRLTLILVGFDLTFVVEGTTRTVTLVPVPDVPQITKSYAVRGSAATLAVQLRRLFPEASLEPQGGRLTVTGRWEDHERIERVLSGETITRRDKPPAVSGKLYSLTVSQEPAGRVVRTVADALGKKLRYDEAVGQRLTQRIDLKLQNATLDYLLESTLAPLGLTWRVNGDALEIMAGETGRPEP